MLKKDLSQILQLNAAQRLMVMEAIWESLVNDSQDIPLPETQAEELEKRLNAYYQNPQAGSPWSTVKERLLSES